MPTVINPVTDRRGASEIVALPRFLLRMMEPLRKVTQVALIINDKAKVVTMKSYHREAHQQQGNAVLQTKLATLLKSETSACAHEFEEFLFQDDRETGTKVDAPTNVKEEVTLVFSLGEPKAMLQFCAAVTDEDLRIKLLFDWGGRPLVFETKAPTFSGELVMATLDHTIVGIVQ